MCKAKQPLIILVQVCFLKSWNSAFDIMVFIWAWTLTSDTSWKFLTILKWKGNLKNFKLVNNENYLHLFLVDFFYSTCIRVKFLDLLYKNLLFMFFKWWIGSLKNWQEMFNLNKNNWSKLWVYSFNLTFYSQKFGCHWNSRNCQNLWFNLRDFLI